MRINSTRFGRLDFQAHDPLLFPAGMIGFESCRQWLLLADADNEALGWLQSIERPEIALAVVSPRPFAPGYQLRTTRNELAPLELTDVRQAQLLVVVGKNETGITLNLKAPLVINLERRLGRQVIANNDYPVQYELTTPRRLLKTA